MFAQRITSGYGTFLGLSYVSAMPRAALLAAMVPACGDPSPPSPAPGAGGFGLCGEVIFDLRETERGTVVRAHWEE